MIVLDFDNSNGRAIFEKSEIKRPKIVAFVEEQFCALLGFNSNSGSTSQSFTQIQINAKQKMYDDYVRNHTLKLEQQFLFNKFFEALKTEDFKLDYSVENEIVFVKKTDTERTLLVIDEDGDGMFSFASRENKEKNKRIFFEYDNHNFVDLISKFKNT